MTLLWGVFISTYYNIYVCRYESVFIITMYIQLILKLASIKIVRRKTVLFSYCVCNVIKCVSNIIPIIYIGTYLSSNEMCVTYSNIIVELRNRT